MIFIAVILVMFIMLTQCPAGYLSAEPDFMANPKGIEILGGSILSNVVSTKK